MIRPFSHPGNKYMHGSYQNIINEIPPFSRLISGFLGSCPIFQYFRDQGKPVTGIELDKDTFDRYSPSEWIYARERHQQNHILNTDFMLWMRKNDSRLLSPHEAQNRFIYLDPPYPFECRRSQSDLYNHEMTDRDHELLLLWCLEQTGCIAISSYPNSIYDRLLVKWRTKDWQVMTHAGPSVERLYMNYPSPTALASYAFLGVDFTDRQRIKRKLARLQRKFDWLPVLERQAIMAMLQARW